jgi:hypothetical protein
MWVAICDLLLRTKRKAVRMKCYGFPLCLDHLEIHGMGGFGRVSWVLMVLKNPSAPSAGHAGPSRAAQCVAGAAAKPRPGGMEPRKAHWVPPAMWRAVHHHRVMLRLSLSGNFRHPGSWQSRLRLRWPDDACGLPAAPCLFAPPRPQQPAAETGGPLCQVPRPSRSFPVNHHPVLI